MKRTISLILCFCILLSAFVVGVSAAESIDMVELVNVTAPVIDSKPNFDIAVPDNSNYYIDAGVNTEGYINGVMWTRYANGTPMGKDETFVSDTYLLNVCLVAKSGWGFDANVKGFPLYGVNPEAAVSETEPTAGRLILTYRFDATAADEATLEIIVVNGGYDNAGSVTGAGTYSVGSYVTVSAKPGMGFGFWGWSNEGDALITEEKTYSFTIEKNTVLIADFFKAPFDDISGMDYFFDAVIWAVNEGITTGTSATTFSANATCTRAQVVTFLHRSLGCPMPMPGSPFVDVDEGDYFNEAVLWAAGSKITTGTSATTFAPNQGCTRAQVVTFMWRAHGCPEATSKANPFTDVSSDAYYYDAVLWAVEKGLTTGTSDTTFSPNATCTRGQIVTFLWRNAQP